MTREERSGSSQKKFDLQKFENVGRVEFVVKIEVL